MNDSIGALPRGVRVDQLPGPLTPNLEAAVRALAADAETADGVVPLSEAALLALPDADATHLLALGGPDAGDPGAAAALVGYAGLDSSDPADPTLHLVVAPAHRRGGIGTTLLPRARRAVLARAQRPRLRRPPGAGPDDPARPARPRGRAVVRPGRPAARGTGRGAPRLGLDEGPPGIGHRAGAR